MAFPLFGHTSFAGTYQYLAAIRNSIVAGVIRAANAAQPRTP